MKLSVEKTKKNRWEEVSRIEKSKISNQFLTFSTLILNNVGSKILMDLMSFKAFIHDDQ